MFGKGREVLVSAAICAGFSLMEKEKSFPHSDMPSYEVLSALISVLRRAPLG